MKQNYQDSMLRKQRQLPPTKEGNTGERIDTNTYVVNTSTLSNGRSQGNLDVTDNGSLNGTMRSPRTPSTHHKNGSTYHSNPVRSSHIDKVINSSTLHNFIYLYRALCRKGGIPHILPTDEA